MCSSTDRRYRHVVGITAHVEDPKVIAAATETPRGERSLAVRAHVAEGHQFPVGLTMNVARSDLSDYLGLSPCYPSGTDQCTHFERLWHLERILYLPLRLSKRIGTWTGLNQR
jgi:hypothetical protein